MHTPFSAYRETEAHRKTSPLLNFPAESLTGGGVFWPAWWVTQAHSPRHSLLPPCTCCGVDPRRSCRWTVGRSSCDSLRRKREVWGAEKWERSKDPKVFKCGAGFPSSPSPPRLSESHPFGRQQVRQGALFWACGWWALVPRAGPSATHERTRNGARLESPMHADPDQDWSPPPPPTRPRGLSTLEPGSEQIPASLRKTCRLEPHLGCAILDKLPGLSEDLPLSFLLWHHNTYLKGVAVGFKWSERAYQMLITCAWPTENQCILIAPSSPLPDFPSDKCIVLFLPQRHTNAALV